MEKTTIEFDTQQVNENNIFIENLELFKNITNFYKRCIFSWEAYHKYKSETKSEDCQTVKSKYTISSDKFTN